MRPHLRKQSATLRCVNGLHIDVKLEKRKRKKKGAVAAQGKHPGYGSRMDVWTSEIGQKPVLLFCGQESLAELNDSKKSCEIHSMQRNLKRVKIGHCGRRFWFWTQTFSLVLRRLSSVQTHVNCWSKRSFHSRKATSCKNERSIRQLFYGKQHFVRLENSSVLPFQHLIESNVQMINAFLGQAK